MDLASHDTACWKARMISRFLPPPVSNNTCTVAQVTRLRHKRERRFSYAVAAVLLMYARCKNCRCEGATHADRVLEARLCTSRKKSRSAAMSTCLQKSTIDGMP